MRLVIILVKIPELGFLIILRVQAVLVRPGWVATTVTLTLVLSATLAVTMLVVGYEFFHRKSEKKIIRLYPIVSASFLYLFSLLQFPSCNILQALFYLLAPLF